MREFIIIVLRKKNKKNYIVSSSYRSITLKNSLIKLIKKILAVVLTDMTERFNLLF